VPPLVKVLDEDADGEISKEEMENAPESLKELDHNEDGKLSRMEIRPNRRFKPKKDD
jgi:Ca2+-binding EF-hand superfamily protein